MSADQILVIEDDAVMRELIVATLLDAGLAAASRMDAHAGPVPKLLVVDLGEPKTGGADSLRALRASYPNARIVAISGRFRFNAATAGSVARQLGADRVLAKPLDCGALVANVRQLMGEPVQ